MSRLHRFNIGSPHARGAGYMINHQNLTPNQGRQEADILTCPHCQRVINLQKWRDDGAWCNRCNSPVCGGDNPECQMERRTYGCVPFLKKLEAFTQGQVSQQQFRKLAGLDSPPAPRLIVPGG